ncbi:hypothetical protein RLOatenuis_3790 [Rickettsiales bacterium]|nr:hypothetical protein RLOatenuis_3790 [Rickettsiales bacterium]
MTNMTNDRFTIKWDMGEPNSLYYDSRYNDMRTGYFRSFDADGYHQNSTASYRNTTTYEMIADDLMHAVDNDLPYKFTAIVTEYNETPNTMVFVVEFDNYYL